MATMVFPNAGIRAVERTTMPHTDNSARSAVLSPPPSPRKKEATLLLLLLLFLVAFHIGLYKNQQKRPSLQPVSF
jgi:hypothetical protein